MQNLLYVVATSLLWLVPFSTSAQLQTTSKAKTLGVSFQKLDIGHGLQIDHTRSINAKWYYGAGLYIHFNALPADDQNHEYHKRGWADEWYEHFGLNLNINRNLITYQSTDLYALFNFHVLRTSFRESVYQPVFNSRTGELYYKLYQGNLYGPYFTLENTLGLGLTSMLSERIGFRIRGGLGVSVFYDDEIAPVKITKLLGSHVWGGMTMLSSGFFVKL